MKRYDYRIYARYGFNIEKIKEGNNYAKNIFSDFFKILKQQNVKIYSKREVFDITNNCKIKEYTAFNTKTYTYYVLEIKPENLCMSNYNVL